MQINMFRTIQDVYNVKTFGTTQHSIMFPNYIY